MEARADRSVGFVPVAGTSGTAAGRGLKPSGSRREICSARGGGGGGRHGAEKGRARRRWSSRQSTRCCGLVELPQRNVEEIRGGEEAEYGVLTASELDRRVVTAARRANTEEAEKWMDKMRDVGFSIGTVTYTTLMYAYRRAFEPQRCLRVLKRMHEEGVIANETTTSEAVRACVMSKSCITAMDVLAHIEEHKLPLSPSSWNAILKLQLQGGRLQVAHSVFQSMRRGGNGVQLSSAISRRAERAETNGREKAPPVPPCIPDVVTYNILISEYSRRRDYTQALATFGSLLWQCPEFLPRPSSLPSTSAFSPLRSSASASSSSSAAPTKPSPDTVTFNSILDALWKARTRMKISELQTSAIVRCMRRRQIHFDGRTATALIRLASLSTNPQKVYRIYRRLRNSKSFPVDRQFYEAAVEAFAQRGNVTLCRNTIQHMRRASFQPTVFTFNNAISACVQRRQQTRFKKVDYYRQALELFAEMEKDRIQPDEYTYCSLLKAKGKQSSSEVIAVLTKMREQKVTITPAVCNAAVSSSGEDIQAAEEIWRHLRSNLSDREEDRKINTALLSSSYLALLRACGAAARHDLAVRVVYALKKDRIDPTPTHYRTFARGLRETSSAKPARFDPYALILKTLCGVTNDMDLPVNRIRIKF